MHFWLKRSTIQFSVHCQFFFAVFVLLSAILDSNFSSFLWRFWSLVEHRYSYCVEAFKWRKTIVDFSLKHVFPWCFAFRSWCDHASLLPHYILSFFKSEVVNNELNSENLLENVSLLEGGMQMFWSDFYDQFIWWRVLEGYLIILMILEMRW